MHIPKSNPGLFLLEEKANKAFKPLYHRKKVQVCSQLLSGLLKALKSNK